MARKGRYNYSQEELDRNKILKAQQAELKSLEERSRKLMSETLNASDVTSSQQGELAKLQKQIDTLRTQLIEQAKKTGIDTSKISQPIKTDEPVKKHDNSPNLVDEKIPLSEIPTWNDILENANETIEGDVILEDLLSQDEFQYCIEEIERIDEEFSKKTKLSKVDIAFLMIATALQTARWVIIQKLLGDLGDRGERISSKEGDKIKKKETDEWNKKHDRDNVKSDKYPTREDIIFGQYKRIDGKKTRWSCPYDAQTGGPIGFDDGSKGAHRSKTLGHDPILGWIFGTANIMTCTITCSKEFNFATYRVVYPYAVFGEKISAVMMFAEVYESLKEDKYRLPAALFAQYAHLKSDVFTDRSLPIPCIDSFSEEIAGKLYNEQYDALCLAKDVARVGTQALFSILINMVISLIHGFFYNPEKDFRRDFYEVRTRRILLFSNLISSSINLAYVGLNASASNVGEALKKLDLGGLLVTIWRLFSDIRFITRIKEQFVNEELNKVTAKELAELDNMFEQLKSDNYE